MTKILITGGAGFIGSNLVSKLQGKNYKITVIDNLSTQIHGNDPETESNLYLSIKDKVDFIKGCITDYDLMLKLILDQDIIIHLASETGTGQSMYLIDKYVNINVRGTSIILDILSNYKSNVKKLILSSSRAVYGEGKYLDKNNNNIFFPSTRNTEDLTKGKFDIYSNNEVAKLVGTDEDSIYNPTSIYGLTKQMQEQLLISFSKNSDINTIILRFQNVYGPGQSLKNPYTGILSIFSTQILNNHAINIFEDGKESRDFIYIDDIINSIILSIDYNKSKFEIFNVGTGIPISVLDISKMLLKEYNIEVPINISGNFRIGDIRHNYANINKIKHFLNFTPKYSFEYGLKQFVKWVITQKVEDDTYNDSILEMKKRGLFK